MSAFLDSGVAGKNPHVPDSIADTIRSLHAHRAFRVTYYFVYLEVTNGGEISKWDIIS